MASSKVALMTALSIGLGLVVAGAFVVAVDAGLSAFTKTAPSKPEEFSCREAHPVILGWFKPNCDTTWKRWQGDELVLSTRFSSDEQGRRKTPLASASPDGIALFFGASIVLGAGVADEETLPSHFSKAMPSFASFNYGVGGFGPHQTLAWLTKLGLRKHFPEKLPKRRVLIEVINFLSVHYALGADRQYAPHSELFPCYELDSTGNLADRGTFSECQPWLSRFYRLSRQSSLASRFDFNPISPPYTDRQIELTARIIEATRERFSEQFQSDEFYVLFWPHTPQDEVERLSARLKTAGIRFFDYSKIEFPSEAQLGDGHPNSNAYQMIAKRLATDLSKIDSKPRPDSSPEEPGQPPRPPHPQPR